MNRSLAVSGLLAVAACSQQKADPVTVCAPDTTSPLILLASPHEDATGVALNARVSATFSEAMDPASLATAVTPTSSRGTVTGTVP